MWQKAQHIFNIGELEEKLVCREFRHTGEFVANRIINKMEKVKFLNYAAVLILLLVHTC